MIWRVLHGYVWRLSKGWKMLGHLNNLASYWSACTKPEKWKDMYQSRKVKGHVQNQESERTCTKPGKRKHVLSLSWCSTCPFTFLVWHMSFRFPGFVHVLSLSWCSTCPFTFLVWHMSFHFPGFVHVLSLSWFCTCRLKPSAVFNRINIMHVTTSMSQRFNIVCATFKIRVLHGYVWRLSKGWKMLGHLNNFHFPGLAHVLSLSWFCTCPFTFLVLYMSFHFPGFVSVMKMLTVLIFHRWNYLVHQYTVDGVIGKRFLEFLYTV
jgi:hypothetical protein